jgi:hypothetical protein
MSLIRLLPASGTLGTATLTLTGLPLANETTTIGTTVYTWVAAATTTAYEVEIGGSASASLDNLIAAINLGSGAGTVYGSATVAHPLVTAAAGAGDTMDITMRGAAGVSEGPIVVATTETLTNGAWSSATVNPTTQMTSVGTKAVNSAPSSATAGAALSPSTDRALLLLYSVNATGLGTAMSVTCKLWGYHPTLAKWFPLGTNATAASKGLINATNAMGETASDVIRHCEEVTSLRGFTRVYLEVTAIDAATTEIAAYLDCRPSELVSRG